MDLKNNLQKGGSVLLLIVALYSCTEDINQIPSNQNNWKVAVQTDSLGNVNGSSAVITGTVGEVNADQIVSRGFCWDTLPNPTFEKSKIETGIGAGLFNDTIIDLLPEQLYYVRAFAKTNYMSFYGDEKSFTTLDGLPVLDTLVITDITQTSIKVASKLIDDGGYPISSIGICWHQTRVPTIADQKVMADSTANSFMLELANLQHNSYYNLRSFAINKQGITYGEQLRLITLPGIPIIETVGNNDSPYFYEKYIYSKIKSDGGSPIIETGFCWSKSDNPTLDNFNSTTVFEGINLTNYVKITNLERITKYYFRAYAINEFGTSYGETKSFVTGDGLPIIAIDYPYPVTKNSAAILVRTNNSDNSILECGIYYSKTPDPTENNSVISIKTPNTTGNDLFELTSLEENTLYYYRGFAINEYGKTETQAGNFFTNNLPVTPLEFVTVDGGTFTMGNNSGSTEESPAHQVELSSFQMSTTEVTVGQFMAFLIDKSPTYDPDRSTLHNFYPNYSQAQIGFNGTDRKYYFVCSEHTKSPDCPIDYVSYEGAKAYCAWVGGRLPTEAEWEFAAKGGNQSHNYNYSGSNIVNDVAWLNESGDKPLHPVGQKLANELGVFDMSGNVMEICNDYFDPDYYKISPTINPKGPVYSEFVVLRGAVVVLPSFSTLTIRSFMANYGFGSGIGFRVVKDL